MVISAALAACASRTPTERERALSMLPSEAQLVAAADGVALTPFRPAVEAARAHLPTQLDCVFEVASTSEVIALAIEPRVGTTIAIITKAHVARCPALSRVATDTYVATIGAGRVVGAGSGASGTSVLEHPRWSRAKPYLLRDPIALAIELPDRRVLAVAQPEPLDAWLSIDAADVAALKLELEKWIAAQRATALVGFVTELDIKTRGNQLLIDANKLAADDLAGLVGDVLRRIEAPAVPAAPAFGCPPAHPAIASCTDGTRIVMRSLATTLRELMVVENEPVIAGGDVIGVRLTADAEFLLRRGDIILGIDAHRITSMAQLQELARQPRQRLSIAVRRDGADVILELSE